MTGIGIKSDLTLPADDHISRIVSPLVGALYLHKHLDKVKKAKSEAEEMTGEIRSAFLDMVDKVDWMEPNIKDEAKKKVQAMTEVIGYPEELLDMAKLSARYTELDMTFRGRQYLLNYFEMVQCSMNDEFSKLRYLSLKPCEPS